MVSAAKGFELGDGLTMTAVLGEVLDGTGAAVAALSGPNIAIEVARGLPAATVVATLDGRRRRGWCATAATAARCASTAATTSLGVEYAGALKNVVAIAAGVCDGIGAGDNGKAAVITRGLAEIARLGVRAGAHGMTFAGLAGLGDCIVTCTSPHSRNRGLGEAIGRGTPPAEAIAASQMVVEGVNATKAALLLAERYGVDMPITREIHDILFAGKSVERGAHRPDDPRRRRRAARLRSWPSRPERRLTRAAPHGRVDCRARVLVSVTDTRSSGSSSGG